MPKPLNTRVLAFSICVVIWKIVIFILLSHLNNNTHIKQTQSAILPNIDIVNCTYCTNILRESEGVHFLFFLLQRNLMKGGSRNTRRIKRTA